MCAARSLERTKAATRNQCGPSTELATLEACRLIKARRCTAPSLIKMASAWRRRLGIGLLMAIGAGALSFGLGAAGKSPARLPFGNVGARRKTLEPSNREV